MSLYDLDFLDFIDKGEEFVIMQNYQSVNYYSNNNFE